MKNRMMTVGAALVLVAGMCVPAQAQLIETHTYQGRLNSGGSAAQGVHQIRLQVFNAAAGGAFELGGTLGQFDAHAPMVGGAFEVTGGFWAASAAGPCNAADLAPEYGMLDFDDVLAFLVAFGNMDPAADLAPGFGVFDFDDVLLFLTAFSAGCP